MKQPKRAKQKTARQVADESAGQKAAIIRACEKRGTAVRFTFIRAVKSAAGCETVEAEKIVEGLINDGALEKVDGVCESVGAWRVKNN